MNLAKFPAHLFIMTIILTTLSITTEPANSFAHGTQNTGKQASVDLAILLDTSNSMDGLINQAKSQLWTIVQQFALAQKNGESPQLRVALFEYGNTNLPAGEGYLRQVVPLGDDLDVLSEALFALTTQGGDEYCGQVINEAITRLDWSPDMDSYLTIFIAGNEPFTQGSIDYQFACRRAIKRDIVVNTIHCGAHDQGVQGQWQKGAEIGHGEFFNIDQDRNIVHIPCPQDPIIIRLNNELNGTYLWYGSADKREDYSSNQMAQDSNADLLSSSVAVSRTITKTSKIYDNRRRDLVDAQISDLDILNTIAEDELPEIMQKMTVEERESYLQEMSDKRRELKEEIGRQAAEREIYLVAELKRRSDTADDETLGRAVVLAIRKQLVEAGFTVDIAGTKN
jgi:hypothetical protein